MLIQEELIDGLFSHHYYLSRLREYVQEVVKTPESPFQEPEEPLDKLINEITAAIQGISKPSFMQDIKQMKLEIQAKYATDLQTVKEQLFAQSVTEMKKYCQDEIQRALCSKNQKQNLLCLVSNESGSQLKDYSDGEEDNKNNQRNKAKRNRNILTKSILECSQIQQPTGSKICSQEEPRNKKTSISPNQQEHNKTQIIDNWHETSLSMKNRLNDVEFECHKLLKVTNKWHLEGLARAELIEGRAKQIQASMEKMNFDLKETIQHAFSGIWNIVSNLSEKIQCLQHLPRKKK